MYKATHRLTRKELQKIVHKNGNQKKAGVARLTLGKRDLKTVIRDQEGRYNNDKAVSPTRRYNL